MPTDKPAMVKARGWRQLSVELTEEQCETLERVRVARGLRSWGAVVRLLVDHEKPRLVDAVDPHTGITTG